MTEANEKIKKAKNAGTILALLISVILIGVGVLQSIDDFILFGAIIIVALIAFVIVDNGMCNY